MAGWEYPEICGSIISCEILDSPCFLLAQFIQLPNTPSFPALFFFKAAFSILVFFYPFLNFLPSPLSLLYLFIRSYSQFGSITSQFPLHSFLRFSHTSSRLFTQDSVLFSSVIFPPILSQLFPFSPPSKDKIPYVSKSYTVTATLLKSPSLQPCSLTCSLGIKQSLVQLHPPPAWDRSGTQSLPQLQSHADIPTITSL